MEGEKKKPCSAFACSGNIFGRRSGEGIGNRSGEQVDDREPAAWAFSDVCPHLKDIQ